MEIMDTYGSCPRCGEAVDYREVVTVCGSCGWSPENKPEVKCRKHWVALGILSLVIAFVHVINWGGHSLEILPLKLKEATGTASIEDLQNLQKVCLEQLKYTCAEAALTEMSQQTQEVANYKNLGDLRQRMGWWVQAIEAYEIALTHVEKKEKASSVKGDIFYGLARSFDQQGDINMAEDYYRRALNAKPGVLQVTVALDFVNMLKEAGKIQEAKKVVRQVESRSGRKGRIANLVDLD